MNPSATTHPLPRWPLKRLPLALLLAGCAGGSYAHAAETSLNAEPPQAGTSQAADAQLKTVTVTARRREESAQNVPTPISVVSGQTLESQRVYRIQDLQQLTPSLNVAYMHARQSSVSIRGLGNNPASDGLEGSVGLYIDNVYLGRPGMAVFDLMDIEQLEVLRGPQGTLFGKNTTAGVVNISTRARALPRNVRLKPRWLKTVFSRPKARSPGHSVMNWPGVFRLTAAVAMAT